MATVSGSGASIANTATILPALQRGQFGSGDSLAHTFSWASGQKSPKMGDGLSLSSVLSSAAGGSLIAIRGTSLANAVTEFAVAIPSRPVVFGDGITLANVLDSAAALMTLLGSGVSLAAATTEATPAGILPIVRAPIGDEAPGTVNLVRNPSLEYADVGLTDWTADAGIALTRVETAGWAGVASAALAVASGGSEPAVAIATQSNLGVSRAASWVGSVEINGDAPEVRLWLRFRYTDATSDLGEAPAPDPTIWTPTSGIGAPAWTPAQLGPALIAWYFAPDIAQSDGSAVASWTDRSGNGRVAAQGTGANQPTYTTAMQNGLAVVRFDGTNHVLAVTSLGLAAQPYSVAAAVSFGGALSADERLWSSRTPTDNSLMRALSGGNFEIWGGGSVQGYAAATTGWHVHVAAWNGASSSGALDGTNTALATPGAGAPTTGIHIGADSAGTGTLFSGDLGEMVWTNTALTLDDRQRLEGHLAWTWGLQGGLPADHPYKNGPSLPVWGRVETPVTTQTPGKTIDGIDLVVAVLQQAIPVSVNLDAAQIEEAVTGEATPYADGNQGAGYRWAGTPGLSMSVREPMT